MNTPDNQSTHVPRAVFRVAVADAGRLERELIRVKDELQRTKAELERTKVAIQRSWCEADELRDRVDAATAAAHAAPEAAHSRSLGAVVEALQPNHWAVVHWDRLRQRVRELQWSEWKEWDEA